MIRTPSGSNIPNGLKVRGPTDANLFDQFHKNKPNFERKMICSFFDCLRASKNITALERSLFLI